MVLNPPARVIPSTERDVVIEIRSHSLTKVTVSCAVLSGIISSSALREISNSRSGRISTLTIRSQKVAALSTANGSPFANEACKRLYPSSSCNSSLASACAAPRLPGGPQAQIKNASLSHLAGVGLFVRLLQAMQMLMGCFRTEEAEKFWLISLFGFPLICAIASRNLHCVPFCFLIAKLQMASVSHSCRKHFLVLYEKYQKAKRKNGPVIWREQYSVESILRRSLIAIRKQIFLRRCSWETNQQSLSMNFAKTANPIHGNLCACHRHLNQFLFLKVD